MKIRLHSIAQNSAGERVRIALNIKGIEYEYVPTPSSGAAEYIVRNPQALMPTLEVDGCNITQSLAAIEYIDEMFPAPTLHPNEPVLRAQSRSFAMAICSELHALTVRRVRKYLSNAVPAEEEDVRRWYGHWTQTTLTALEKTLRLKEKETEFCFADYPTLADIALVPQLANARRFDCDTSAYPILNRIDAKCSRLSAFVRARPDHQIDHKKQ